MIKIIQVRSKWVWGVVLFLLAVILLMVWQVERPVLLPHPPAETLEWAQTDTVLAVVQTQQGPVALNRIVTCLDINQDRPLLIKGVFSRRVDYVYCHTILSSVEPVTILHRWKRGQKVEFERRLLVHGKGCRLWSRRQNLLKQPGVWSVEIVTENGIVLGQVRFQLM
jgi:hypothetical protein